MDRSSLLQSLLTLRTEGRSGVLEVRSDGSRTFLYLLRGEIVFAEEESVGETLGRMLVRQEKLTPAQYVTVLKRMTEALIDNEQLRFGEVAVELGYLSEGEVARALADQVRWKVIRTLEREEHEFTFSDSSGQVEGMPQFVLRLEPLVLEAARWVPDERKQRTLSLVARDRPLALREPLAAVAERYQTTPDERSYLACVDGTKTIGDLLALAKDESADATAVLTALVVTKGIAYVAPRAAPPAVATPPTPPAPLAALAPPSEPKPVATPPARPVHRGLVPTPAQFTPFKGPVPDTKAEKDSAKEKADRALALLRAQRMGKQGTTSGSVAASASALGVQTPTGAFKPVGALGSDGTPASAQPPNDHEARLTAEQEIQRGKVLLFQGQTRAASAHFERARKLQPANIEFELFGTWTEFVLGVANVDQARGQLKRVANAAAKADPNLAFAYYVMGEMALLDKNEGFAKKMLTHALKLDPKLVDAQRRLRLLKK